MTEIVITHDEYREFCVYLESKCGIVLGDKKQYLVRSRLFPLLGRFDIESISVLFQIIFSNRNKELSVAAIDAMTTNETLWFRDVYPFEVLAHRLLPDIAKTNSAIKIWSAASSSGQEPYSIAMTIKEVQSSRPGLLKDISITATDISSTMLKNCRSGIYDNLALSRGLSVERKKQFFHSTEEDRMIINDDIKRMVTFKEQNLMESYASLGKFDIIFCRNVLIYFSLEMKLKVINQMEKALNPGGYLLLGASESLTGINDRFEMIRCNPGIIYKLSSK